MELQEDPERGLGPAQDPGGMYHELVIAASIERLQRVFPEVELREHSLPQVEEWVARLDLLWDEENEVQRRPFKADEVAFVASERLMCKAWWRYWAERYCRISSQGAGLTLLRLWESQELILNEIAALEVAAREYGADADGILVNILKARQLGASTLSQAMVAHRVTTQADVFAIVAGDVPAQSTYIVDMLLRVLDNLPWWMKPGLKTRVETFPQELEFLTGSHVWSAAGDSTRGENEKKGNIGRGKTPSVLTLTELSTWAHPEQIDGSLMPGVPVHPRTLALFESTAKGMGNWWDKHWDASKKGIGRFRPVFIPWYAEKRKHRLPAPINWAPTDETLKHARLCEEGSSYWMGRHVSLTRDQLYWYEQTRATFEHQDRLHEFLEEYPATDEEAFQVGGIGIFSPALMSRLAAQARPIAAMLEVLPRKDIVLEDSAAQGLPAFDLPPGYGFRWLTDIPSSQNLEALEGFLLIFEPPRKDQRYVVSVDVAGGVGADRSVIEVTRVGTVEEPDEQVAEFVSAWVDHQELALIAEAVGHLYHGVEDEALMAVELTGMGIAVQGELQRHTGYSNFFVWQYEDARNPAKRFSTKIGFETNRRTRPIILGRFVKAVRTVDETTGYSDLRLNSPHAFKEMRRFVAPPGGHLWDAEAAPGAHDDCVMSLAVGEHVVHTLHFEAGEPLAETRRRLHEEAAHRVELAERDRLKQDYINTPCSAESVESGGMTDDYGSTIYTWP